MNTEDEPTEDEQTEDASAPSASLASPSTFQKIVGRSESFRTDRGLLTIGMTGCYRMTFGNFLISTCNLQQAEHYAVGFIGQNR